MDFISVLDMFEGNAVRFPNEVALCYEKESMSYETANIKSNQIARYLDDLGVEKDDRIAVYMNRSPLLALSILAIAKSGGTYVPIDDSLPSNRVLQILNGARPKLILCDDDTFKISKDFENSVHLADGMKEQSYSGDNKNIEIRPDSVAYIIFTSGTTGKPNGVQVTHKNLARLFSSTKHHFDFNQDDVWALFHSVGFDFSVWEFWGALSHGAELVIVPYWLARNPVDFCNLMENKKITVLNQTPSSFNKLIKPLIDREVRLDNLRYIVFGGEALQKQKLHPWVEKYGLAKTKLINMYGITETTVHTTYYELNEKDFSHSSNIIGKPLIDLKIHLLDDDFNPVKTGETGEIFVEGDGVSKGYLNDDQLTNSRFIRASKSKTVLYRTGDLGLRRKDGNYEYHGRRDNQVKIRGFRIELDEIKIRLLSISEISDVAITSYSNGIDEIIIAFVKFIHPMEFSIIRKMLRAEIPDYMVPSVFVAIDEIPINENGKQDIKFLVECYKSRQGVFKNVENISTKNVSTVDILTNIVSEILEEKIEATDNFLDVGGNSISSALVLAEIAERFSVEISMLSIFSNNLVDIANEIDSKI